MSKVLKAVLALALLPGGLLAEIDSILYFELWQPQAADDEVRELERSQIRLAVGDASAELPIAGWCVRQRETLPAATLPLALLRDAPYDAFETSTVPLKLELLIDDVELRYALGTERPLGADGVSFPYFELCALGFGRRADPAWALEVVHLSNARGQEIVVGLYKGVLPASEREFLAATVGYDLDQPDPAGILVLGQGEEMPAMLLVDSPDGSAFGELRSRIVR